MAAASEFSPPSTRRILDAALVEFSEHGYRGARIERIALNARANKQLIYHYFGDKRGLYEAVMGELIEQWLTAMETSNDVISADSAHARTWSRMMTWEGLTSHELPVSGMSSRRESLARTVIALREQQKEGLLDAHLDPQLILLLRAALAILPWVAPHLVELVTGADPVEDSDVRRKLLAFGETLISEHTRRARLSDTDAVDPIR